MKENHIRKNRNSFSLVRNSRTVGKFRSIDDAVLVRDLLIENDWDCDAVSGVHETGGKFVPVEEIDGKLHVLGKFDERPSPDEIGELRRKRMRNPNFSKYGLNISRIFDTFTIKKRIAGEDHVFGYYDNLADAEFVRNFLLDHSWNVNEFSQIEYDSESGCYKVVETISDMVYVLATFDEKTEIDIDECHEKFLARISKHKFGLASHPYLDELTGEISSLENRWHVRARDENWSFENAENPLKDIVFNLTPWQKIVYDAVDSSTFDEIQKSLIRYKSKNFDVKIRKNLDELVGMGLIVKNQDCFEKRNF